MHSKYIALPLLRIVSKCLCLIAPFLSISFSGFASSKTGRRTVFDSQMALTSTAAAVGYGSDLALGAPPSLKNIQNYRSHNN